MHYLLRILKGINSQFWRKQRGFSLLELLVSVAILAVIGTAVINAMDTNYRGNRTLDENVTAVNLSTAYIEAIRNLPFAASYPAAGDNIAVPAQYSVNVTVECSTDAVSYGSCDETSTFQRIRVGIVREDKTVLVTCAFRRK